MILRMLDIGDRAPEFTLPDQDGHDISLTALTADGPAILYFYPADFTPGCTREACSIRDIHRELTRAGLTVAGISPQSPDSHRRFREKHGLPFPILADSDKAVAKQYGVLKRFLGTIELAKRDTFLIDPTGKIVRHYADVDPKGHSQVVLKDIKELSEKKS